MKLPLPPCAKRAAAVAALNYDEWKPTLEEAEAQAKALFDLLPPNELYWLDEDSFDDGVIRVYTGKNNFVLRVDEAGAVNVEQEI